MELLYDVQEERNERRRRFERGTERGGKGRGGENTQREVERLECRNVQQFNESYQTNSNSLKLLDNQR